MYSRFGFQPEPTASSPILRGIGTNETLLATYSMFQGGGVTVDASTKANCYPTLPEHLQRHRQVLEEAGVVAHKVEGHFSCSSAIGKSEKWDQR